MKHKCLAFFIVFLLFFTISSVISFYQLRQITTVKFIKLTLNQSGLYSNIGKIIDNTISTQSTNTEEEAYLKSILLNIDPIWAQSEIEKNVPLLIEYLNSQSDALNVNIDLTPLKSQVSDPSFSTLIPDQYKLTDSIKNPDVTFYKAKLIFKVFQYGFIVSLILSVLLILFLLLLGLPNWQAIFRTIGWAIVIPALVNLIFGFGWLILKEPLKNQVIGGFKPELVPYLNPVIHTLNNNIFTPSILLSFIILIIGFITVIISYFLKAPNLVKKL